MRIAVDAMGGDHAPDEIVAGVLEALPQIDKDDAIVLVGPKGLLEQKLAAATYDRERLTIVDAPDVIGMDEKPVDSLRKKPHSSISVMAKLAKTGDADAVISAGNTGACVAAFQMRMRTLPGVNRPGIAVVFPSPSGPVTICDVGANIACKPLNLYQYGLMASIYSRNFLGIQNPRIGLMSIGEEDAKGNEVVKKAADMLRSDPRLTFIGNIEGRDIFRGVCDVVVCEGFVGNVVLKLTEGAVDSLFRAIKQELMQEQPQLALMFKPVIMRVYQKHDYNEYGGAPLLGIDGTALICHGASKARTIRNAVRTAKTCHTQKINERIMESLAEAGVRTTDAEQQ
ncbi:MAG: phosphate acyltransferase PlsX [Planctomycetes bacterium]|nr:phosphate acyltransferase PlsX [Planctomycetota bacterium]